MREILTGRALPWVIAAILLVLVFTCRGDGESEPILSEENRREADSLRATLTEYVERQDSLREAARAAHDVSVQREAAARRAHLHATKYAEEAERARVLLLAAKNSTDSLSALSQAYDARTKEAEALSVGFDSLDAALTLARKEAASANERAQRAEERAAALQSLNQRIIDDIAKAEKGCEILGIVKCPSRKTAFAIGYAMGAATVGGIALAVK